MNEDVVIRLMTEREDVERQARAHCEANDGKRAATILIEAYGREIRGFLDSRLGCRDEATEVFSAFAEDLWRGLDSFRWQCSARVWLYTLARHAASRHVRDVRKRRARSVPLSQAGPLPEIQQAVRTATLVSAQTESRSRAAKLRETLPLDDQTLLILRVNRKLGWKEIAQVMTYEGEVVPEAKLEKEVVRLRKRYQLVTERLHRLAVEQGLVPPKHEG